MTQLRNELRPDDRNLVITQANYQLRREINITKDAVKVLQIYQEMRKLGVLPTDDDKAILIPFLLNKGKITEAVEIVNDFLNSSTAMSSYAYITIIKAFLEISHLEEVDKLFNDMRAKKIETNVNSVTIIDIIRKFSAVAAYAKAHAFYKEHMNNLKIKSPEVAYDILQTLVNAEQMEDALDFFRTHKKQFVLPELVKPNGYINNSRLTPYMLLIKGLARAEWFDDLDEMLMEMKGHNVVLQHEAICQIIQFMKPNQASVDWVTHFLDVCDTRYGFKKATVETFKDLIMLKAELNDDFKSVWDSLKALKENPSKFPPRLRGNGKDSILKVFYELCIKLRNRKTDKDLSRMFKVIEVLKKDFPNIKPDQIFYYSLLTNVGSMRFNPKFGYLTDWLFHNMLQDGYLPDVRLSFLLLEYFARDRNEGNTLFLLKHLLNKIGEEKLRFECNKAIPNWLIQGSRAAPMTLLRCLEQVITLNPMLYARIVITYFSSGQHRSAYQFYLQMLERFGHEGIQNIRRPDFHDIVRRLKEDRKFTAELLREKRKK